jgi:hypothetical protein
MELDIPRVAGSLADLLAGATERVPLQPVDARSGGSFERVRIEGRAYFLKVLAAESDWIMRVTGNTTHWEWQVWNAGLYDGLPPVIDHTMVAMALDRSGPLPRLGMLMTDCADDLVPPGDALLPPEQHARFLDHLAAMHAARMGWTDTIGLQQLERRFLFFAPEVIAPELTVEDVPGPVRVADQGWALLDERAPDLAALVRRVHADPSALADALCTTPATFVAGDWKAGNLGSRPDGRTILLDWAYPGEAPPCWELAWYLALNRSRLPESKEAAVARYHDALERHGVDTGDWWARQLGLCLVGIMAAFAWEKAVGDEDELAWWSAAALDGARWLE